LARAGLESILAVQGVEVAGSVPSLELLADRLGDLDANVLLIDTSGDPIEAVLESIRQLDLPSEAAVVLLADHPAAAWLADAVRAGVGAVLPAEASREQLVAAMRAAIAGLTVMPREEIASIFPAAASRPLPELTETLTPREREVLQMLASGLGNKEMATRLAISEHTVKFHVSSILGKLGAAGRTEAVTLGIRYGLVLL
jgi:DNA-binding NarL/FixJ family response regulator